MGELPEVEIIADFLHEIWSKWYTHQRDNSTKENVSRWEKQSQTNYWDLSYEDKEKDLVLARKLFDRLKGIK